MISVSFLFLFVNIQDSTNKGRKPQKVVATLTHSLSIASSNLFTKNSFWGYIIPEFRSY